MSDSRKYFTDDSRHYSRMILGVYSMDYLCRHCYSDLDAGDVLNHFLKFYRSDKAIRYAKKYGWTSVNRLHFDRSIIIQGEQEYRICPDCGERDPFSKTENL